MSDTSEQSLSSYITMSSVKEFFLKKPFLITKDPILDYLDTNSGMIPRNNFASSDDEGGGGGSSTRELKEKVEQIQNKMAAQTAAAQNATDMLSDFKDDPSEYHEVEDIIDSVIATKKSQETLLSSI